MRTRVVEVPKKVLIAEDYADIRLMTRIMVESLGYDVIEARDGYEAYEAAKEFHPDIILMDIAMPVMNGITAATMIRGLEGYSDVPIIAVTAYGEHYADTAGEFGFDRLMAKPVEMAKLKSVLSEVSNSGH